MEKNFMQLTLSNVKPLKLFIDKFFADNQGVFFKPHKFSYNGLKEELLDRQKDIYVFLLDEQKIYSYGILRGWEEGYEIPSLGILVDIYERGNGYSYIMMDELHRLAKLKGAKKVRLRVIKENKLAISLYNKLGYVLSDYDEKHLVGFKNLE